MKIRSILIAVVVCIATQLAKAQTDYQTLASLQGLKWSLPQNHVFYDQPNPLVEFTQYLAEELRPAQFTPTHLFSRVYQLLGQQTGGIGPPMPSASNYQAKNSFSLSPEMRGLFPQEIASLIPAIEKFINQSIPIRDIIHTSSVYQKCATSGQTIPIDIDSMLTLPIRVNPLLSEVFLPDSFQDLRIISLTTRMLMEALNQLLITIANVPINHIPVFDPIRFSSPLGDIVLTDKGDGKQEEDAFLLMDFGGHDIYTGSIASAISHEHNLGVVIEMGGNDQYVSSQDSPIGSGVGGMGILIDLAGDDQYYTDDKGIGYACFGSAFIYDCGGDDQYVHQGHYALGSAFYGAAIVLDQSGNDAYKFGSYAAGFGSVGGIGMLLDGYGDDTYTGYGRSSFTMGASKGRWGYATDGINLSGGLGILLDYYGNDRYSAHSFSLGSGYYWGTGIMADLSGDDSYDAPTFSHGSAAHYAAGSFIDFCGNDAYNLHTEPKFIRQTLAYSRDFSTGLFQDNYGDDLYRFSENCMGVNEICGKSIFRELCGCDQYQQFEQTSSRESPGQAFSHSFFEQNMYQGVSSFVDFQGNDRLILIQ